VSDLESEETAMKTDLFVLCVAFSLLVPGAAAADPLGACCEMCVCRLATEAECVLPGMWMGPGTNCSPSPCDCPPGICCHPDGTCTITVQPECQSPAYFYGFGISCYPDPCSESVVVEEVTATAALRVVSVAPNPSAGPVTIEYESSREGALRLEIFNAAGSLVSCTERQPQPEGRHALIWDGRDNSGVLLPTGFYFARLLAPSGTAMRHLIVAR
jgi:hypothetical protein